MPLLGVLAALVRADGGTVFYRHRRIGAGGRMFDCIKFRSMVLDADGVLRRVIAEDPAAAAEWAETQKLRDDPRITRIGRFLRRSSLDELPQLFNVLRGEMSLVGPRPIVQAEVARYGDDIEYYYAAKPGLTGLWQVSGRSDMSYAQARAARCLVRAELDPLARHRDPVQDDSGCLSTTWSPLVGRTRRLFPARCGDRPMQSKTGGAPNPLIASGLCDFSLHRRCDKS